MFDLLVDGGATEAYEKNAKCLSLYRKVRTFWRAPRNESGDNDVIV